MPPVFSKISIASAKPLGRLAAIAAKTKAKVGPRMPRGSTVVSGVKLSFAVATALGLSVPYMQGVADAAKKIMEHADAMKTNRKECKKLGAATKELVNGLLAITKGVEEDGLTDELKWNLAELDDKLQTIGEDMAHIRGESFVRRLLSNDEHAEKIKEHRRTLKYAVDKFQVMQLARIDCCVARIEKKQGDIFNAVGMRTPPSSGGGAVIPRHILGPHILKQFVAMTGAPKIFF